MWKYLLKRIVAALITIWVTTIAVVLLIHIVPGDPVRIMYAQSQGTTQEQLEAIRHNLGLDRPIYEQYLMFMGRILRGDFGRTIRGEQPVFDLLMIRLPYTLLLSTASLLIAMLIGLSLGFIAAYKRATLIDTGCHNSLREFFSLLSLSDILISSDTLALHAALALKKKVVGLFGPTSASEIELYGRGEKVVAPVSCRCCYLPDCDVEPNCMESITPEMVFGAVKKLL